MPAYFAEHARPARVLNFFVGLWLLVSAFAWPHGTAARTNDLVVAVLCMTMAFAANRAPPLRFVNTALAVWLFASLWIVPRASIATGYNDAVVALVMFLVSLVPPWRDPGEVRRATA
jgi:hypothetical protein